MEIGTDLERPYKSKLLPLQRLGFILKKCKVIKSLSELSLREVRGSPGAPSSLPIDRPSMQPAPVPSPAADEAGCLSEAAELAPAPGVQGSQGWLNCLHP